MDSPSTTPAKVPACIHHKGSGQAMVKLAGRVVYLGPYGSETAAQNYRRRVAEWQATGGQAAVEVLTVDHVIAGYWRHAEVFYGTRCTSKEALQRFFDGVTRARASATACEAAPTIPQVVPPAEAIGNVDEVLRRAGIAGGEGGAP